MKNREGWCSLLRRGSALKGETENPAQMTVSRQTQLSSLESKKCYLHAFETIIKTTNCVQKLYLMCLPVKVNYAYESTHYVKTELIHLHIENFISQISFRTKLFLFSNYFKNNYLNSNFCYYFLSFVVFKCFTFIKLREKID